MISIASDAAPLLGVERLAPSLLSSSLCLSRRLRRRGPRSLTALLRRSKVASSTCPVDEDSGEPRSTSSEFVIRMQPLNIISVNIRSIINKIGELVSLAQAKDIHVIMCQESWLDASTPNFLIPGFMQLSRRDRSEKANRGGVIVYVRLIMLWLYSMPHMPNDLGI